MDQGQQEVKESLLDEGNNSSSADGALENVAMDEETSVGEEEPTVLPGEPENITIDTDPPLQINEAIVEKLTYGVLEKCLPDLQKAKGLLDEVLQNQQVITEAVHHENAKFSECTTMNELSETMIQAKKYYIKLMNIKKEMTSLQDRSHRLKKRALKIQQQKQKEELQRAQQRERELERERMLTAKVAKKPQNAPC